MIETGRILLYWWRERSWTPPLLIGDLGHIPDIGNLPNNSTLIWLWGQPIAYVCFMTFLLFAAIAGRVGERDYRRREAKHQKNLMRRRLD